MTKKGLRAYWRKKKEINNFYHSDCIVCGSPFGVIDYKGFVLCSKCRRKSL
jgi:ribosomal protein S14